jgi:adenylosuccinate lyase
VLITALRRGVGRETAHEAIKEHAIAVALQMRETGRGENDLLDRLATDPRLGVTRDELDAAIASPLELAGTASQQVLVLAARIESIAKAHPGAAGYRPYPVL